MAKVKPGLTERERVEAASKKELMDSVPKVLVYAGTVLLIWIFAMMVFAPLGGGYEIWSGWSAGDFILGITILVMLLLLYKVLKEIRDACEGLGGLIAVNVGRKGATKEEVKNWQTAVKGVAYVIAVAVAFMFFAATMKEIGDQVGETLAGVVLVVIFLWAVYTLYKSGMAVSKEIEARATEWEKKILLKEAKD